MPFALAFLSFALGMQWKSTSQATEPAATFRVGAATGNITPPLGEMIVGGWVPVPAKLIHDELHARCVVFDDGQTKVAIVACDNVGIPREVFDFAKHLATEATQIPESNMLLASTHTHSATTARGENKVMASEELTDYQRFLAQRISDAIVQATHRLQPAKVGFGSIEEPSEVFNRRWFVTDARLATNPFGGVDQVRMNPPRGNDALDRQAGPVDPEISFIAAVDLNDRPIALIANYSLHYVGGVPSGEISADYFGCFAESIAGKLNVQDHFVAMLTNGTSGDVNNIDFREKTPRSYKPYEKMVEVADKVASRVHEAFGSIQWQHQPTLASRTEELTLNVRKPDSKMLEHFAQIQAGNEASSHRRESIYADRIERIRQSPDTVSVPLQVLRIGDIAIAGIPFETFAETGLEIKQQTASEHTFTIELAGGSFGYLPTPRQHRFGGYETWLGTNYVQTDASELIVDRLMTIFDDTKLD